MQVRKRNGETIPFKKEKIVRVLELAGLTPVESQNLATQLETWANSQAINGIIEARELKRQLIQIAPPETAQKIKEFVRKRRLQKRSRYTS